MSLRGLRKTSSAEETNTSGEDFTAKFAELTNALSEVKGDLSSVLEENATLATSVVDLKAAVENLKASVEAHKMKAAETAKALADYEAGFESAVKVRAVKLATEQLAEHGLNEPIQPPKTARQINREQLRALNGEARAKAAWDIKNKVLELVD